MELANAYTELNDPLMQEELFTSQLQGLSEEDSMAKMDRDFVLALKHGMPPAGGLGIGVDRLCMLLTDSHTIRDTIIFPLLKPKPIRKSADGEAEERRRLHGHRHRGRTAGRMTNKSTDANRGHGATRNLPPCGGGGE